MTYRADIDGLRAIAVGVIVLFHIGLHQLSGGFIGVDIFFVISGYLITTIVLRDLAAGRFSFRNFYMRRLRRLGPALLVTLAVTLIFGYLLFTPDLFAALAWSSIAAIFSLSNVLFWLQSGYFDTDAILKPLLHTWSLAVEEQFYLIWPAALLLLAPAGRLGARGLLVLAAVGLTSLLAAELMLERDPAGAFFLPMFRLAEFGIGAGLAVHGRTLRPGPAASLASLLGLALIAVTSVTFSEDMRFPGLAALLPCLGSGLIILAGPGALANRLLARQPFRYIGRISYSLYLVHWPVVVFLSYRFGAPDHRDEIIILAVVSLALGALLYHLIETPFRRTRGDGAFRVSGRQLTGGALALVFALTATSGAIIAQDGIPGRMNAQTTALLSEIAKGDAARGIGIRRRDCHVKADVPAEFYDTNDDLCLPPERREMIVVMGDSHAADIYFALETRFPDLNIVQMTGAGCAFSRPYNAHNHCSIVVGKSETWLPENAANIRAVIYSQRGSTALDGAKSAPLEERPLPPGAFDHLRSHLDRIAGLGIPVLLWGPRPEFHPEIEVMVAREGTRGAVVKAYAKLEHAKLRDLDAAMRAAFASSAVDYHSTMETLCTPDCPVITPEGQFVINDFYHWSPEGGQYVTDLMLESWPALREALR
ncbi:acyltransferase family protein [Poseidonocella sedimentorum]|uniref:Peptidoglycan/LPS O-acetylase OafA/YrhL, contains acyltransferase and SGNH-hydrolase domains n=1 Tax=Poseidonocella sedimentorum TaxID=871652 RepID=A0A1I6EHY0_9RHOB|nr:acyltransferase family protein [Poseidonocella sedimentorum]SFR17315.1 Peptidoglycan/LPS O-acetylase OafA/YrhL, contains acyltransferase and SGNH-hydrolase domains [Poseidonocella sedimentorum]